MPSRHVPCPDRGMSTNGPCSHPQCYSLSAEERARNMVIAELQRESFEELGKTPEQEIQNPIKTVTSWGRLSVLVWGLVIACTIVYSW